MTTYVLILFLSSLYIWGVFASDLYLTNASLTTDTFALTRKAIFIASLLWPVAVIVAIVRIVLYFVFGKKRGG